MYMYETSDGHNLSSRGYFIKVSVPRFNMSKILEPIGTNVLC